MATASGFDPRHPLKSLAIPRDALRPPSSDNRRLGLGLSLLAHVGLIVALAVGVQWRTADPEGVSAELWAAVPQVAAPRAEPPPPAEEPTPAPPPPPRAAPPQPSPAEREAEIAIEKARQQKLDQQRQEEQAERERQKKQRDADKREAEKREAEKERQERERAEAKQREQQKQEQQRKDQAAAAAREKARQDQLRRMSEQLGGTGDATSTGTAARSAGPSASYAGRLAGLIRPNVNHPILLPGNPTTEVTVTLSPAGDILSAKVARSSGTPEWDQAVVNGIIRTGRLPRDENGRLYSPMTVTIRQN
ncbi:energy transducer TonB [Ideonella sp.]|uniref:cell envelope integrity protein TolA n=1 Tax=Ideonella sp. TaxID=1929293 RepID=UPI0035B17CD2